MIRWCWREEKEGGIHTDLLRLEPIHPRQRDRQRRVNSHHPTKDQHVIEHRQKHNWLADDSYRPHQRVHERVLHVPRAILLDTEHTVPARAVGAKLWLIALAIVVGLLNEEHDRNQTQTRFNGIHPEGNLPFLCVDDECCQQWTQVGRENDEAGPDVYLTRMLVEKEHVFDEHQAALYTS